MSNLGSAAGCGAQIIYAERRSLSFKCTKERKKRVPLLVIHQRESADLRYKVRYAMTQLALLSSDKACSGETLGFEAAERVYIFYRR